MIINEFCKLTTEEKEVQINKYKEKIATISNKVSKLSVPYNDISVLLESTPELELVNSFFDSVSCSDKGIENLLYEVIGYSLFKTAKLSKSFILKRQWS